MPFSFYIFFTKTDLNICLNGELKNVSKCGIIYIENEN